MFRKTLLMCSFLVLSLSITSARPLLEIEASGILKVGVPSDYAPLAFYKNNELIGFDVDVANALAEAWDLKVEFIKTTWVTFVGELEADQFDIVMGGISFTEERNDRFQLTKMIIPDGMVALTRCTNTSRLQTMEAINYKPNIVVVTPGGTNEDFVNKNISKATIVRTSDNLRNVQMIRDKEADMMITDMSVANYYRNNEQGVFCITSDQFFEGTERSLVYMSQKGNTDFIDKLNGWLNEKNLSEIAKKWGVKLSQ